MKYRVLGRTGIRVSELCLGAMTFGGAGGIWQAIGALDESQSAELVRRALDAGVNFFDTADAYANGESETILGKALAAQRRHVVIATKVAFPMGQGPNDRGLSRGHLLSAAEASLRRLGTDYIDLYQLHTPDKLTPIEETLRALDDLVRAGKVRYVGASNYAAWQVARANTLAGERGWTRFEAVQMNYNLASRDIEREIVPMIRSEQVALLVWSPLAGGVLTGKYGKGGEAPVDARRAAFDIGPVDYPRVNRILEAARPIAEARGTTLPRVMLAWLLAQDFVTSVIIGAKRMNQLEDNLGAAELQLSGDEVARLSAASELPVEYPGWYLKQFENI